MAVPSFRADVDAFYHYDGLGSARQMTDSNGSTIVSYTYDGFGNLLASSGAGTNPYGFTGEQQFGEADDLVFLRARYYDPRVGRFINRDPILSPMQIGSYVDWLLPYMNLLELPQSLHPYVYVKSNPIIYTDPLGEFTDDEERAKSCLKCFKKIRDVTKCANSLIEPKERYCDTLTDPIEYAECLKRVRRLKQILYKRALGKIAKDCLKCVGGIT